MEDDTNSTEYIQQKIKDLYKKILKREPDKAGLYYFVLEIKAKRLTLEDVEKDLSASNEAVAVSGEFDHYSDKYWNDLDLVVKYRNKLATGDENLIWIMDIEKRFKEYVPFDNALVVGCGNGWVERLLDDLQIAKHYDCFDISEKYISEAKSLAESRPFNYFIDDINSMKKIEENKYDVVFNFAVLHHATNVDFAIQKLAKCLKKNGLMFNEEYVGPSQNQYSDDHLERMLEVMSDLPEKYRSKVGFLRPPLDNFRVEPSEAIHSDLLLPSISKYFDIVYQKSLNGGVAYQILHNNIEQFEDYPTNSESKKWLEYLIKQDKKLSDDGLVPSLFWYGVVKPKI